MNIKHIDNCFELETSKLPDNILSMEGMSGRRTRHFYNNICSIGGNYLEIGCWKGSSTCSALYGNSVNATVIDNWSEFGDKSEEFFKNINPVIGKNKFNFINSGSWEVDLKLIPKIDIYLYDGGNSAKDHEMALTYYKSVLADTFIYIVDDWAWKDVQAGTYKALENFKVLYQKDIITENSPEWWNGIGVFLLQHGTNNRK
jgi:hypothetical protein